MLTMDRSKRVQGSVPQGSVEVMSKDELLTSLSERHGATAEATARVVLGWMAERGLTAGVSKTNDSIATFIGMPDGKRAWPFFIRR